MQPFDAATVSLEPGVSLVEASAGTGKTYSITQLVLRLLLSRRPDRQYRVKGIGSILVVTFTKAATDELITRVRSVLREATEVFAGVARETGANDWLFALRREFGDGELGRLREALSSLDQLAIFTIHGWSKRVLEESALESGTPFGARFIEDDDLMVRRIAEDWWRRTIYEDVDLATLAVHGNWAHDAFLEDLKKWQRLPKTTLDPDRSLAAAQAELRKLSATFARNWDAVRARTFLDSMNWRKNAPLADDRHRGRIIEAGDAFARGSLAAGMAIVQACSTEAIRDEKTGIKQKPAERFAAVDGEPWINACDTLLAAFAGMLSALRVSCLVEVHAHFSQEKRRRHILDFDDLLRRLHDAITTGSSENQLAQAIRSRYDAALIDEFQDTDPFQFPIFSKAFAGRPLFLIGDPKQAIFSFRGADLFAYITAASTAERRYTLGKNYRSTVRMVSAVNGLFSYRPNAFLYSQVGFAPASAARTMVDPLAADDLGALHWWVMPPSDGAGGPCQLSKGDATRRAQAATVQEIVRLLSLQATRAALRAGQIAVLVRAGFEGIAMQQALRAAGVPSIVSGMDDILKSREMMDLEAVLHAILVPGDARSVRGALSTELWGASASEIHRLAQPEHESDWQAIAERLVEWRERWVRSGFMRMVHGMLGYLQTTERLLANADGERRVTNLRHAVELLHTAASEGKLSPDGLLLWIANTRATGEEKAERTELRLESDADAVQIVTVHKSKGLQYDVVFCPTLWATRRTKADEPVLVHEGEEVVFDHGSPAREARGRLAAAEELAEELRVVYVALTRARFRCYVAWGAVINQKSRLHAGHTGLGYLLRSDAGAGDAATMTEAVPIAFADSLDRFTNSIAELVQSSGGVMSMSLLGADVPEVDSLPTAQTSGLVPTSRTDLPAPESLRSWRVTSFTSLTAGRQSDDARDVSDAGAQTFASLVTDAGDFLAFPAGRLPGIALHELFELVDFAASALEIRTLASGILERSGLHEPADRIGAVTTMVERVLSTPLPDAGFTLRDVPRARTLREWAFYLPLGAVDGAVLSRIFAEHGGDLGRRYAPALRHLTGERVFGFLTGVVDLALEHGGRWYVLDWKSNHLGFETSSYETSALEREMVGSHYVLQYHLYLTALHRFLRARVPGYDYGTNMGGAWYAFLRGIDGTERGWFHDQPPRALIDALDALMDSAALVEMAS